MVLNNRGQTLFIALMLGVICFVLGMALSPVIKGVASERMDDLNCSQPSTLSTQTRTICTSMDMFTPLITGIIFGMGGILLGSILIR